MLEQKRISHPCYRFPRLDISCPSQLAVVAAIIFRLHLDIPICLIPCLSSCIQEYAILLPGQCCIQNLYVHTISVALDPAIPENFFKNILFPSPQKSPCDLFVVWNYLWLPNFLVTNFLCLHVSSIPFLLAFSLFVCFREQWQWVDLWGNYVCKNMLQDLSQRLAAGPGRPNSKC